MSDLNIAYTEQYVLACLLQNKSLVSTCPNYFISNIGKSIYNALVDIVNKDLSFTPENIILYTSKSFVIDHEKITILQNLKVSLDDFPSYIESLKVAYLKDKLKTSVIKDLILTIENKEKSVSSITDHLDKAYSIINEIDNKKIIGVPLSEALEKYKSIIIERSKGTNFYPTGIGVLDLHNPLGFHPKYMTTIFGKSGVGKTTVGTSLFNAGINRYIPSVYNSLEMDMELILDKIISNRTGIPFSVLAKSMDEDGESIADYLVDMVEAERKKIQNNRRVMLVDENSQSISDLDYEIPKWKKFMDVDYLVLHLDLATMLSDFGSGKDSTASTYEQALNKLHTLARKHNIHLINYVQSQRDNSNIKIEEIEDIVKFKPTLANIKNSSAFEERSRVVLGLHREKYYADRYLPNHPMTALLNDELEIQFLKNTMGTLKTIPFLFQGATSKIFPIVRETIEKPEI